MFVRWQKRESKRTKYRRRSKPPGATWSVVLAESVRVNGKPRQKHIAYLGSFNESILTPGRICVRGQFWKRIRARLDNLKIPPGTRRRIEAAIAKKVRPLSRAQQAKCDRGFKAWVAGLQALAPSLRRRRRKITSRKET
jgi:hypothetical protein